MGLIAELGVSTHTHTHKKFKKRGAALCDFPVVADGGADVQIQFCKSKTTPQMS